MTAPTCHSEIRPFTSYKSNKGVFYVILDINYLWEDEMPTDTIDAVVIMNVQTEKKEIVCIREFEGWIESSVLVKL